MELSMTLKEIARRPISLDKFIFLNMFLRDVNLIL